MKNIKGVIVHATGPATCGTPPCSQATRGGSLPSGVTRRGVQAGLMVLIVLNACVVGWAEEKNWNGSGDKTGWFDDANWYPAQSPTATDNALVDILDASVGIPETFHAKSVTLGGKKASTITVSGFTSGDVIPDNVSDDAFYNRKSGVLILKSSAGKVTLKGAYKTSHETVPEESSFMFYAQ